MPSPLPTPNVAAFKGKMCVVIGAQFGDEGKGKFVSILAAHADICARFNGGANVVHTIKYDEGNFSHGREAVPISPTKRYAVEEATQTVTFSLLPCGITNKNCRNVLGNGTAIHLPTLDRELAAIENLDNVRKWEVGARHRLYISSRAHLVFDLHKDLEEHFENNATSKLGSSLQGIGPCYSTKSIRNGLRMGDLLHWDQFVERFRELVAFAKKFKSFNLDVEQELARYKEYAAKFDSQIIDTVTYFREATKERKTIVVEGATSTMKDIDFGAYPYVTASNTTIGNVLNGLGVPPQVIDYCVGVTKGYTTRVNNWFPTVIEDEEISSKIRAQGDEVGTMSLVKRRIGWLDLPMLKYGQMINGFDFWVLTKLYALSGLETIKICTEYSNLKKNTVYPVTIEEFSKDAIGDLVYKDFKGWGSLEGCTTFASLPSEVLTYISFIEKATGVPVLCVQVGPGHHDFIFSDSKI